MQQLTLKLRRVQVVYMDHSDIINLYPDAATSCYPTMGDEPCLTVNTQRGLALAWLRTNYGLIPDEEIDARSVKYRKPL